MSQQLKERPASMLRAMFAGLGSLLSVMDKVRSKHTAKAPVARATPAEPLAAIKPEPTVVAEPELVAVETETVTVDQDTVTVETEVVTVEPVPAAPQAVTPAEPEVVVPGTPPEPEPAPLPLANYDELTIASLRARLRTLSVDQLTELLAYEKTHAARPDVITMFERRITKVQTES